MNLPALMLVVHVGEFFGYKAIGIYQSQQQIDDLNSKSPTGIYRPVLLPNPEIVILKILQGMAR
jgi:hypothetical protein